MYLDLGRNSSLRKKIFAAEQLSSSAALNPNILFSIYRTSVPSASGGIWKRMRHVHELDSFFQSEVVDEALFFKMLSKALKDFNDINLLTHFSKEYGKRFLERQQIFYNSQLNEIVLSILLLSKELPNHWYAVKTNKLLLNVAMDIKTNKLFKKASTTNKMKSNDNFSDSPDYSNNNEIIFAITNGLLGIPPRNRNSTFEIQNYINSNRKGAALLKSLNLLSEGLNADFLDLEAGLAGLVMLGFNEQPNEIAIELLVKTFIKELG